MAATTADFRLSQLLQRGLEPDGAVARPMLVIVGDPVSSSGGLSGTSRA
jgi:hypothetical protein